MFSSFQRRSPPPPLGSCNWQIMIMFFPESERTCPPVGRGRPHSTAPGPGTPGPGRARARRAPAVARGDMTDVDESAVDKNASFRRIRQSTRCQQKGAVEAARRLLSAVSRNQAAFASQSDPSQNKRQRFLLTGESDNNRRREAGVSAGGQKACRTPGWPCR